MCRIILPLCVGLTAFFFGLVGYALADKKLQFYYYRNSDTTIFLGFDNENYYIGGQPVTLTKSTFGLNQTDPIGFIFGFGGNTFSACQDIANWANLKYSGQNFRCEPTSMGPRSSY